MLEYFWITIAFPFIAFVVLTIYGQQLKKVTIAVWGALPTALSTVVVIYNGFYLFSSPSKSASAVLWQWIELSNLSVNISFQLDALSWIFSLIITFVGALILLYSTEFMQEEEGYARFFAYMNLFIASMLILVLADNLLLLYLGWEGVGLCSFLLIGFWYKKPKNGYAAQKAFIVTRIGDVAMAIGLFLLVQHFGTLNITQILDSVPEIWGPGNEKVRLAALLLLGGAVGKSAQLPLQTWLPDAMAGPSPVSALIHAATMVTAGVYLIARTHVLFELSPLSMQLVAWIGALTLLMAGFSALFQKDIKKVLAYSTISQIGYMFLALGVGAWSAAIFHFAIHAFFKALLFLGAGSIIISLNHEHNMFKMGGLRKTLPVTFWTFIIAAGALAALPFITSGFYSKDLILWKVFSSKQGGIGLWAIGFVGAIITALYTFRMVFVTFFGKTQHEPNRYPGWRIKFPLVVLGIFSLTAGWIELPHNLGHLTLFSDLLDSTLPEAPVIQRASHQETLLQIITSISTLSGVGVVYWVFIKRGKYEGDKQKDWNVPLKRFLLSGWEFDKLYNTLFVKPYRTLTQINKNDFFDHLNYGIQSFLTWLYNLLSQTQNGRLRWYMAVMTFGLIIIVTLVILT
ncbi:MAG: NADH-quinone oxidoreductase subunit L [Fulvivirga sp.]|nr:NADH-quinone oxidoreductase subunit L [Fulvivirga sp.]